MFGAYHAGKEQLPRVLHISVARYRRDLPKPGEALRFLVSIHEEGTGITWQQNVTLDPESERYFLETTQDLYLWSLNAALTPKGAQDRVLGLGRRLYETFIGPAGKVVRILAIANPTLDLAAGEREIVALRELEGNRGGFGIEVSVLTREKATRGAFAEVLANGDYDILHFSGHGSFDP